MTDGEQDPRQAFGAFFSRLPDAFLLLDAESFAVTACNAAAAAKLRSSPEDLIGKTLRAQASHAAEWEDFLRLAKVSLHPMPGAFRHVDDSGNPVPFRVDAQALPEARPGLLLLRLRDARAAHRDFSVLRDRVEQLVGEVNRRRQAEEQQKLLVEELNHRVMNMLSTVQAMVRQTLRGAKLPGATLDQIDSRIASLATGHRLIARGQWKPIALGELVSAIVLPLDAGANRISMAGPACELRPNQAIALAMALHELAANAAKYGALAGTSGQVNVGWDLMPDARRLRFSWIETGGPAVTKPSHAGFGSRLIKKNLPAELGGKVELEYRPDGLRCHIEFPCS